MVLTSGTELEIRRPYLRDWGFWGRSREAGIEGRALVVGTGANVAPVDKRSVFGNTFVVARCMQTLPAEREGLGPRKGACSSRLAGLLTSGAHSRVCFRGMVGVPIVWPR